MNHDKYEERLATCKTILQDHFQLLESAISPVAYDATCKFPYNNFIYRIDLPNPVLDPKLSSFPCSQPIPSGTSTLLLRLSNNACGANPKNRVENEVAAMSLARTALSGRQPPLDIVPRVYGWSSASAGQGWILQEFMAGVDLDGHFPSMELSSKRDILRQVAEIVGAMQKCELPSSVRSFGGLSFDKDGEIVGGEMTTFEGGPFESLDDYYAAILRDNLEGARKASVLNGWKGTGLDERIERFIASGIGDVTGKCEERKYLVHGDLTTNNLLFDPSSQQITAILDFDWSHIGTAASEYLHSFHDIGAKLPSPYDKTPDGITMRKALIHEFPIPLPSSTEVSWEEARLWDEELAHAGALRPRNIEGMEDLAALYWFSEQICPWRLSNEVAVQRAGVEKLEEGKREQEVLLARFLGDRGY